jgi:hypothetical protein
MLGDAIVFILCLNEHKGNVIGSDGSDGVQIPKKCATTVPERDVFKLLRLASSGKQIPQVVENTEKGPPNRAFGAEGRA